MIIYDSVFGNTKQVAETIAKVFESDKDTRILQVSKAKPDQLTGLDLLVFGSPTRAFNATAAINRFLKSIPKNSLKGVNVATFDTRISLEDVNSRILPPLVKVFGYAAKPIADKLEKKGAQSIIPPEGFFVKDTEGPMKDGELERASEWAKQVITHFNRG